MAREQRADLELDLVGEHTRRRSARSSDAIEGAQTSARRTRAEQVQQEDRPAVCAPGRLGRRRARGAACPVGRFARHRRSGPRSPGMAPECRAGRSMAFIEDRRRARVIAWTADAMRLHVAGAHHHPERPARLEAARRGLEGLVEWRPAPRAWRVEDLDRSARRRVRRESARQLRGESVSARCRHRAVSSTASMRPSWQPGAACRPRRRADRR